MPADLRRLSILTAREIDALYGLPRFTDEDRSLYFDLSAAEREAVGAIHTASAAAHLVLQMGYFKAKRQFFVYHRDAVLDDLRYILQQYFPGKDLATIKALSKPTRLEQQQIILKLFNYELCDSAAKAELECKAQRIARLSTQPVFILREALQRLANQRIVAPGYTFLQDMVARVVTGERKRITQRLEHALTPAVEAQLAALLQSDAEMYRISVLKHEPKSFSYQELRQEVECRKLFQPLYAFAQAFLSSADLSNESVKYYASLVQFYTVYKLQRMAVATTRLYLLCYAHHRFRQINDNLIEAFIHWVDHYEKQAKLAAEDALRQAMTEAIQHLKAAGQVLNLFVDPAIPTDAPFALVKEKAFSLLDPERFPLVADYLRSAEFDKTGFEWAYYTTLSPTFKRNLRHLFSELDFAGRVEGAPLLKAVAFLQDLLRQGNSPRQIKPSTFPTAVIPKGLQRYLFHTAGKDKRLDVDRYEFLVYRLLRNALEAGDVYVQDSTEFRRFEDDLISDVRWQDKDAVLREIGAPILLAPIEEPLATFRETLEAKFTAVNQRIDRGDNHHTKVRGAEKKRRWTLAYPDAEEAVNHPFFGQLPGIGAADLLWFVAGKTGFLRAFTHVLDRYVKHDPSTQEILACIIAMGTNMGLWKMAEVSGLSHPSLMTTARNYLRLETLRPMMRSVMPSRHSRCFTNTTSRRKSIPAVTANASKRRSIRSMPDTPASISG